MSDSDSIPASPRPEASHEDQEADSPAKDVVEQDLSDDDSVLSEIDEEQFDDFDAANISIDERPQIAVDEDTAKLLVRHKRKRDGDEADKPKKKKEGRREKPRRKKRDEDDNFSGGEEIEGKRQRKKKAIDEDGAPRKEKPKARQVLPEDEEGLDPEERRRRALDRAMDAALKNPNKRRRKMDGIDIAGMADEEITAMRSRMADAAQRDVEAREANPPRPAAHKLKLLPEVVALLSRNGRDIESALVDPENNLLEAVRFFLEPLRDGSLPAYNIQRELFAALVRLPIDKEALISSGIGKVVLFYTKSKKPELGIKRTAEKLLADWTRPILKRSDNYRQRALETRSFDPATLVHRPNLNPNTAALAAALKETPAQRMARELKPPTRTNRARLETTAKSYTIVPQSQVVPGVSQYARPMGASGDDAFRRLKARQQAAQGKGPRR